MQSNHIGQSILRTEDDALVRGQGRYVDDLRLPRMAYAVFVRSPIARAKLIGIHTAEAEKQPGVLLILTGRMTAALGALSVNPVVPDIREAIAVVVAESADAAQAAADLVEVDYEALPAQSETASAIAGAAIFSEWPNNEAFSQRWQRGDVDSALANAEFVVAASISTPRVAPMALEPRATVAAWAANPPLLTVWLGTQTPHRARTELARILELDRAAVRVIAADVGGAFGGKASIYPEDVLVAAAAIRLGRPVKWIATRNEDFVSASHGRGGKIAATAAVTSQGILTAIRAEVEYPLGLWGTYSAAVPAINAARILPGPYRIPAVDIRARGFVTNTAPVGIYRGAGRPEAAMIMERLIDRAAVATNLDPAEIRRRNLLAMQELPCITPTGQRLDSGDYHALLDSALGISGYTELRRVQVERRAAGELFGIGICVYVEPCGQGWESARITAHPGGKYVVACGTSTQGQGHRTALAQIAADCLGSAFDSIEIIEGDTSTTPAGVGALASRSIAIGGSAIKRAAVELLEKIVAGADPEIAPVEASVIYTAPHEAWSSGCAICTVSIDANTGELQIHRLIWIDDAGLVINPQLVEGQLLGGLAQGLGQILCEQIHYDADGQLLTGSLMDYALLRADQMPPIDLHSIATSTDANLLGAKGVGESGCIVAPALVLNAALDALRPLGINELSIPLTSRNIWHAIQQAPLA
jgi:aerobic carbon-monoxide dehydrogenase large subunit